MIFFIGSSAVPPTLVIEFTELLVLKIYIAKSIAKKSNIDDAKTKTPIHYFKRIENLIANSDPKIAPTEPPAIINP